MRPGGWILAGRLRLVAFLVIAAFMVGSPAAEQVFRLHTTLLRSWTMFGGIGLGVIDASFAIRQPDGTLVPLDRFEMLGTPRDGKLKRIEKQHRAGFHHQATLRNRRAGRRHSRKRAAGQARRLADCPHGHTVNACAD